MMRWLFYADTPLQLYLSARIASNELKENDSADIMVCDKSLIIKSLAFKLVEEGIFARAYFCSSIESRRKSLIVQIKDFLGKSSFQSSPEIREKYDRLALSIPLDITMDLVVRLRKANPYLDVVLYEDGTGTYDGQIFNLPCYLGKLPKGLPKSNLRQKIYRAFGRLSPKNLNIYTPSALYLRSPDAFDLDAPFPCKNIGSNTENTGKIKKCFSTKDDPIIMKSVIFLDSHRNMDVIRTFKPFDSLIDECIGRGIPATFRSHPGSKESSPYSKLCLNGSGGVWEIICDQSSVGESILVGCLSTAQLAPFLENGSRPHLLFLYKLMIDDSNANMEEYDEFVKMIKKLYGAPYESHICDAESYDEALCFILESGSKLV